MILIYLLINTATRRRNDISNFLKKLEGKPKDEDEENILTLDEEGLKTRKYF